MSNRFSGMTVRERLYELGTIDEFNSAIRDRNEEAVRKLLKQAEVDDDSIEMTISNMDHYDQM